MFVFVCVCVSVCAFVFGAVCDVLDGVGGVDVGGDVSVTGCSRLQRLVRHDHAPIRALATFGGLIIEDVDGSKAILRPDKIQNGGVAEGTLSAGEHLEVGHTNVGRN